MYRLRSGYDRSVNPDYSEYRPMTPSEAKRLRYGDHIAFLSSDGTARAVKVNGDPRTWKRDANRVEVPCKYGMREYATFYSREDQMVSMGGAILLVPIPDPIPACEVM